ncbi:MAG: hypothetical protein ABID61_00275 [Candidatus Micrarchaeota archaeon]
MDLILTIPSFLQNLGVPTWTGTWLPLSILAVLVSVLIHNILLMLAKAFSVKELENYATSEILQAASTGFMAISLVVIVSSAMTVAGSTITGSMPCFGDTINIENGPDDVTNKVMDDAYRAILCRIQEKAKSMATIQSYILDADAGTSTYNNYFVSNMALSIFGITYFQGSWLGSVYEEIETRRIVNNLLTTLLIGLNAQMQLIGYIRINMLHIFIPLGVLLRSFYFTRGPGAFMIALGVGLYFIFPVFYVLMDPGFVPAPPAPPNTGGTPIQQYCYPTMSTAVSVVQSVNTQGATPAGSSLSFSQLRNELGKTYIGLILHPLIAFFLTMVFVRYMMSILGADTTDMTKMITKVI